MILYNDELIMNYDDIKMVPFQEWDKMFWKSCNKLHL